MGNGKDLSDSELFIEYSIRMTKGRIRLIALASAVLLAMAIAAVYLLGVIVADHFSVTGGLPPVALKAGLVLFLALQAALAVWRIVIPLARRINDLYVARLIEKAHPDFRNDLTAALQLFRRRAGEPDHAGRHPPPCGQRGVRDRRRVVRQSAKRPLENALLNLVLNARDAMPEGGHLLIETRNSVFANSRGASKVPLGKVPAGEYMGLFVTDTGVGMLPDVIARAFDPFFTTKPTGEGTGLGLSMIYGFVRQSGGHVLLSSEKGQGTMVSIYLPRRLGAADGVGEADAETMPPQAEAGAVILLVEDELAVRMVVVEVLSDLGYTVLEADNSQSGLRIVETRARIDLLLTDVGLPGGMNGRQLADAAREQRPGLKVLFLTGYAESAAVGKGRMEHGMEVMTKPFDLDKLVAKVEGMISG